MPRPTVIGRSLAVAAFAAALAAAGWAALTTLRSTAIAADTPTAPAAPAAQGGPLQLPKGAHIALIGNTLPDRMQHDGYLETLIHAKFPDNDLVVRNLAAAGDEIVLRHRSQNFGTPDEWLARVGADVIFAFFGFNESFKGKEGLDAFKADLARFLKETAAKKYGANGNARVVLFSPIAAERHRDPNFPDPAPINANLDLYVPAMAEVAAANGVNFVDLYAPSRALYDQASKADKSLTINGIHLSAEGNRLLAGVIFQALFNQPAPTGDLEKLRAAVNEKNYQWHQRYRTVDGFNVYGGRSKLAYEQGKGGPKLSNYEVMQQEMSQRDVLTANRDKLVWAIARGQAYTVDDSNLPPVTPVKTNRPGAKPDGSHEFISGEDAIAKMKLAPGLKVNLFADEQKFPLLAKPVQMAWDTRGRLWVAAWPSYPERTPTSKDGDSLIVFEDTDGDGRADTCTPFASGLNCPTGFQFYKDGVLVMQAPDLWFMRDTDGDGKADWKERVLMGMDSADSHHTTNAMALDPGGAVYLSDGVFHRTQVETAEGPVRNNDAAIFRFEPRTGKFETYIPYGFANPHGRVFDYWGNDLVTDATGNNTYFGPAISGKLDYPNKHKSLKQFWDRPSRPCPGTGLLTSRHFPDDWQGTFLNLNVISFQGIYHVKINEQGSGLWGTSLPDLVSSSDPNFRPTAVSTGPDGALYFCDWHNPIIGHMQHHIRDPNRDHIHGRIYRITYEGRPLMKPAKIDGQPVAALLDLLKEPENQTRELAKIELGERHTAEVLAAVKTWAAGLDKKDPAYEHHMMEALWVHQWHNVVDVELLHRMLRSPVPQARAAATRVLCYWRDRVPGALTMLKTQAQDEHPRVRLEAVRAASFFRTADAAEVVLAASQFPTDYYLEYVINETMRQLEPFWKQAVAEGKKVGNLNAGGLAYLIKSVSTPDLLKMQRTPAVRQAILSRPDVPDATRTEVLNQVADERNTTRARVLMDLLKTAAKDEQAAATMARLLPQQQAADLSPLRDAIEALAANGASPAVRQPAWGALASIALSDNTFVAVWDQAAESPQKLTELVSGLPYIFDPDVRAKALDKVTPLLAGALPGQPANAAPPQIVSGRYVRIELPKKGPLTLAEVQVFSGGKNIAPAGKATQSTTAFSGDASKAIDGRTDGAFNSGTQTHTAENAKTPAWWELDLGAEKPIEAIAVWNRTENDGHYAKRLEGFTLTVLDGKKKELFRKANNPAPAETARFEIAPGAGNGSLRAAAIRAAVSMNKGREQTFAALVDLIQKNDHVTDAARGIRVLPRNAWPRAQAGAAAQALVAWAKTVPADKRTTQEYVEAVQVAGDLAAYLPPDQASGLRAELKQLKVAVFVLTAVREQMRYDTPRLVVEAGKPFEIIFENTDFMPHNVSVVILGSREKIGEMVLEMRPDQLDKQGRAFMPAIPEILAGTKLVEPGQKVVLKVIAPSKEGDYEYMCTYPGHWEQMWGTLVVTRDPEAYLKAHAAPAKDNAEAAAGHQHHHH